MCTDWKIRLCLNYQHDRVLLAMHVFSSQSHSEPAAAFVRIKSAVAGRLKQKLEPHFNNYFNYQQLYINNILSQLNNQCKKVY